MSLHVHNDVAQGTPEWLELRRGIVKIPLTRGLFSLIDQADEERVRGFRNWHALQSRNGFYAAHRRGDGIERMHTFLTGWPLVDHINGDTLDNRRSNLRPATLFENAQNRAKPKNNSSGFKGVCFHRPRGRWNAYITSNGARHHLGYFDTAEEAAHAYDAAARRLNGEFARLNFPEVA